MRARETRPRFFLLGGPGGGSVGKGLGNGASGASSDIILEERRATSGSAHYVPKIVRDGRVYDRDLDRFLLALPANGLRSPRSLRAYGYDIVVWLRFLDQARNCKQVWDADGEDVAAFFQTRRKTRARFRISAASWNRSVAALDKMYAWAKRKGLIEASPFTYREAWQRGRGLARPKVINRNTAYEAQPERGITFVSLDDFRAFREVGLKGRTPDSRERPGARDRNGTRNTLFAELLVTTGLRLEEASSLLAFEVSEALGRGSRQRQITFDLPAAITKGDRGRTILIPARLLAELGHYIGVERTLASTKFKDGSRWKEIEEPILIKPIRRGTRRVELFDGGAIPLDRLMPDERCRLVLCNQTGEPQEVAALWLTEVGQPVKPNSWEAAFLRASQRCAESGIRVSVSPHQLRHVFATHMLAMLIERRIADAALENMAGDMEGYRRILGDPLQQVQRLMGHAHLSTTYIYLDHIASRADTIDAAVEGLMASIGNRFPA